jgi:transcriptional regulator with PAS, ATPase and Fis domain
LRPIRSCVSAGPAAAHRVQADRASSVDLEEAVRAGRFREDLYYRLTVFEIALPPLRARRGDIAKLAHFFLVKYARSMNRKMNGFSPDAMLALKTYEWPGNV